MTDDRELHALRREARALCAVATTGTVFVPAVGDRDLDGARRVASASLDVLEALVELDDADASRR